MSNFFGVHNHSYWWATVSCTCGHTDTRADRRPHQDREISKCPSCGTTNRGSMGRTRVTHADVSFSEIGDKQFRMSLQVRIWHMYDKKMIKDTKYEVGFNYLDKRYDIKVNGRDPRTKDIAGYYARTLSHVSVHMVLTALKGQDDNAFWHTILGTFPQHEAIGYALSKMIRNDYSGVEVIATSRIGQYLKDISVRQIKHDFDLDGSLLNVSAKNLREALGMTKGEINAMLRVVDSVLAHPSDIKTSFSPLAIMRVFKHYLKTVRLPVQTVENMMTLCLEEGNLEYIMNNKATLTEFLNTYNYKSDPIRLIRYLVRDIKLEQGIMSVSDGARLLRDYIRMMTDLDREYERYPSSLKKVHDIAAMNYKVVADAIKERNFSRRSDELKEWEHRGRRFSFVLPQTPRDLVNEGTSLHHCVASYVDDVIRSNCAIVFMRSNQELDKSHVTIEVRNNRIVQARGQQNRLCTQEEKDAIRAWANAKDLVYQR